MTSERLTPPSEVTIRPATTADHDQILNLYRAVAAVPGGLVRTPDEITAEFVAAQINESLAGGLILVACSPAGPIVGEIHVQPRGIAALAHVLGGLTIAVHPQHQGIGVGRALFLELLRQIVADRPDIHRVELMARETNQRAIRFYLSLGFQAEGRMPGRVRTSTGATVADIPMAWLRAESDRGRESSAPDRP